MRMGFERKTNSPSKKDRWALSLESPQLLTCGRFMVPAITHAHGVHGIKSRREGWHQGKNISPSQVGLSAFHMRTSLSPGLWPLFRPPPQALTRLVAPRNFPTFVLTRGHIPIELVCFLKRTKIKVTGPVPVIRARFPLGGGGVFRPRSF